MHDYATQEAAVSQPFTHSVVTAHEEVSKLADRIGGLADRLCGSTPPEPTNAAVSGRLTAVPNGVFADVSDRGVDMNIKLDRIRRDLSRIERELP